uniref:Uncharacterized protein n=1 Tax=Anguilla anguilla TaxID=7936 RepID=A0A0E9UFR0_ANGAN
MCWLLEYDITEAVNQAWWKK